MMSNEAVRKVQNELIRLDVMRNWTAKETKKTIKVVLICCSEYPNETADVLIEKNGPEILMKVLKIVSKEVASNRSVWLSTTNLLYYTFWFITKIALNNLTSDLCHAGLVDHCFKNMDKATRYSNGQTEKMFIVVASINILYHTARVAAGLNYIQRISGFIGVIEHFVKVNNNDLARAPALLCLAHITTDFQELDEDNFFKDYSDEIQFMVDMLKEACETPNKCYGKRPAKELDDDGSELGLCYWGYSAAEITEGLGRLASHDINKEKVVNSHPALDLLVELAESFDANEQISAINTLWTLSFNKNARSKLLKTPGCIEALQKAKSSPSKMTRRSAIAALFYITGDTHSSNQNTPASAENNDVKGHSRIMISYQWEYQHNVVKIKKQLQELGYDVWIDIDNMMGLSFDSFVSAMKNSSLILLCISSKYKASGNCRSEAEYILQLGKEYIPLKMEPNYQADGWLGHITASKTPIDFSNPNHFQTNIHKLLEVIQEKGLTRGVMQAKSKETKNSMVDYLIKLIKDKDWAELKGVLIYEEFYKGLYGINDDGDFPLHFAARNGRFKAVEIICLRDPGLANKPNSTGLTPSEVASNQAIRIFLRSKMPKMTKIKACADNASGPDTLNHEDYAEVLVDTVLDMSTPVTIGMHAKWGAGKSFLCQKIKHFLRKRVKPEEFAENNEDLENGEFFEDLLEKKEKESSLSWNKLKYLCCYYPPLILKPIPEEIPKPNDIIMVDFNAWVYAGCDRLWAGLIIELCNKVEEKYGYLSSRLYRATFKSVQENMLAQLEKQEKKLDLDKRKEKDEDFHKNIFKNHKVNPISTYNEYSSNKKIYKKSSKHIHRKTCFIPNTVFCPLVTLALLSFIASCIVVAVIPSVRTWVGAIAGVISALSLIIALLLNIKTLCSVFPSLFTSQQDRIEKAMNKQEFSSELGFMAQVKHEVMITTKFVHTMDRINGKTTKIVIFVDDLDRCPIDRVPKVIEAIHVLLAFPNSPFICFLAVDPRIAINAVQSSLFNEDIIDARVNGYQYMKKIVQIPFYMPENIKTNTKQKYFANLISQRTQRNDLNENPLMGTDTDGNGPKSDRGPVDEVDSGSRSTSELPHMSSNLKGNQPKKLGGPQRLITKKSDLFSRIDVNDYNEDVANDDQEKVGIGLCMELGNSLQQNSKSLDDFLTLLLDYCKEEQVSYFINGNPRHIKRIYNTILVSGRLAFKSGQNCDPEKIVAWTVLCEQWPYRISCIVFFLENLINLQRFVNEEEFLRQWGKLSLSSVFGILKKYDILSGPQSKVNKLLAIDDNVGIFLRMLGHYPLAVNDIRQFLPFTVNLDFSIRETINCPDLLIDIQDKKLAWEQFEKEPWET